MDYKNQISENFRPPERPLHLHLRFKKNQMKQKISKKGCTGNRSLNQRKSVNIDLWILEMNFRKKFRCPKRPLHLHLRLKKTQMTQKSQKKVVCAITI